MLKKNYEKIIPNEKCIWDNQPVKKGSTLNFQKFSLVFHSSELQDIKAFTN